MAKERDEALNSLVRPAGYALVAASIGTVAAMWHHPTGSHGGPLGPLVHATMILLLALLAFGFTGMATWRGAARPLIVAGILGYVISLFGHVIAGTINGFVVPSLAARGHGAVSHDVFLFAWEANQAFAKLGVLAMSTAYLLWAMDFLSDENRQMKAVGLLGLLAGLLPAGLLLAGAIKLNVVGALLAYSLYATWAALVGFIMARGSSDMRQPA